MLKICLIICKIKRINIVASKNKLAEKEIIYTNTPLFLDNYPSNLYSKFSPIFTPKQKNSNQIPKASSNAETLLKYTLKHEFEQKKIGHKNQGHSNGKNTQSIKEIVNSYLISNTSLKNHASDKFITGENDDEDMKIPDEGPEGYNPNKVSIYGKGEIIYQVFEPGKGHYKLVPSFTIKTKKEILSEKVQINEEEIGHEVSKFSSAHQSNKLPRIPSIPKKTNNQLNHAGSYKYSNENPFQNRFIKNEEILCSQKDSIHEEIKTAMNIEIPISNNIQISNDTACLKENQSSNSQNIQKEQQIKSIMNNLKQSTS